MSFRAGVCVHCGGIRMVTIPHVDPTKPRGMAVCLECGAYHKWPRAEDLSWAPPATPAQVVAIAKLRPWDNVGGGGVPSQGTLL